MKNAVISIWYIQNGKSKSYTQGKFYYEGKKPIFLVDVDNQKLWKNYNGYSISKQITDMFSKLKLRVRICYRLKKSGLMYETNLSTFTGNKSILVNYGGHSQWVLPLKNWKVTKAITDDPHGLPIMDVGSWLKPPVEVYENGKWITL